MMKASEQRKELDRLEQCATFAEGVARIIVRGCAGEGMTLFSPTQTTTTPGACVPLSTPPK